MTVLVDWQIKRMIQRGEIGIEPYNSMLVQPNSLDVSLGSDFVEIKSECINTALAKSIEYETHENCEYYILGPHKFVLATTLEKVRLPDNIVAQIEGKSSLARLGLTIHQTGGWIDAGFSGQITLELFNATDSEIVLYPDMSIGQLVFHKTRHCKLPYNLRKSAHYRNQTGVTTSRYDG